MNAKIATTHSNDLEALSADILRMGGLVESMISGACSAAAIVSIDAANAIIARDREVDALEADIERRISTILAVHQPVDLDLRDVLAALKISNDLERVGDLSKNIAKRTKQLADSNVAYVLKGLQRMGTAATTQLTDVLDAYRNRDADQALSVWRGDEDIDQFYNSYFQEILTSMTEDPRTIVAGAHILFMAKNVERIGDHATNIAELVYFSVTGEYLDGTKRPKADRIDVMVSR